MGRKIRRGYLPAQSEAAFQQQVIQLARFYGWRHFHVHDSRRSAPGFPDLVLLRGAELIFAELKTASGRVRAEQIEWLRDLTAISAAVEDTVSRLVGVPGAAHPPPVVDVFVWRPADFDALHARLARGCRLVQPLHNPAATNDTDEAA